MKATTLGIGKNALLTAAALVLLGSFGPAFATEDPGVPHDTPQYPQDPLPPVFENQATDEGQREGTMGADVLRTLWEILQALRGGGEKGFVRISN